MKAFLPVGDCVLHVDLRSGSGPGIVLLNSLGTDTRLWDDVVAGLPRDVAILRIDKRGHGLSQRGAADMDGMAADVAKAMDHFGMADAMVIGVSIGGMIAQSLALQRPDLVRRLILSNTAARVGDAESWAARIDTLHEVGLNGMADSVMDRWFPAVFRERHPAVVAGWRAMLTRTTQEGYANACGALRDCDLRKRSGGIQCPTLCLAGSDDEATPPPIVRDLADLIPGSEFEMFEGVGHLPMAQVPKQMTDAIRRFYR